MKNLPIIACLVALASAAFEPDDVQAVMKECGQRGFQKVMKERNIEDKETQKFAKCFLKETGALKDDGTVDFSVAKKYCEDKGTKDCSFYDECASKKESTPQKTYVSIVVCAFDNLRKPKYR